MIFWLVLAALAVAFFFILETRKPKNFPPGPARLPLIGYAPYMPSHLPHKHMRDLSDKYGPVVGLFMPRKPWVIVNSYEAVKEVLLNDDFSGRPERPSKVLQETSDKGLGILFATGEVWQTQRQFTLHHFRNLGFGKRKNEDIILRQVEDLITKIETIHQPFNIQKILGVSSINVLWSIMGGGHFKRSDPNMQKLIANINKLFQTEKPFDSYKYKSASIWRLIGGFAGMNNTLKGYISVGNIIKNSVKEHKRTMINNEVRDFIDVYLQEMQTTNDQTFSEEQLVALCVDIFLAGVETNTSLISFCIFYVCLHPSVQQRAQAEIDKEVGRDRRPNMGDRENLVYVDSVYTEIFRLRCPAVTTVPHLAVKDTTLQGYNIPKGTIVLPNLYSVFHDPSYWRDPGIFRPARFLDNEGKLKKEERFFPFGKGKRACLGESLARMTTFLTFVCLIQKFSFNFDPNMLLMDTEGSSGFTLGPPRFKVISKARF